MEVLADNLGTILSVGTLIVTVIGFFWGLKRSIDRLDEHNVANAKKVADGLDNLGRGISSLNDNLDKAKETGYQTRELMRKCVDTLERIEKSQNDHDKETTEAHATLLANMNK